MRLPQKTGASLMMVRERFLKVASTCLSEHSPFYLRTRSYSSGACGGSRHYSAIKLMLSK